MSIDERMQKLMQDAFHDIPGHPARLIPGITDISGEKGLLRDLHSHAMDHAENAHAAQKRGTHDESSWWMALSFESFVAMRVDHQPGKSILARSAAALALNVKAVDIVRMFVARGLDEGCPGDIAAELREILATAQQQWPEAFQKDGV
jgi:hypothetical protein